MSSYGLAHLMSGGNRHVSDLDISAETPVLNGLLKALWRELIGLGAEDESGVQEGDQCPSSQEASCDRSGELLVLAPDWFE